MRKHNKILVLGVTCLILLFVMSSLFGCKTIPVKKSEPKFQSVYNEVLDKTYIIPGMFPDPYNEKLMEDYCYKVFPMSARQFLVGYWKAAGEECEIQENTVMYGLVFDRWSEDIIAALFYVDENNMKCWIYKDWVHPEKCTRAEQGEWLRTYDEGNSKS